MDGGWVAARRFDRDHAGILPDAGRHPANAQFQQPGIDVDPQESMIAVGIPTMGVFDNLVVFDQNSLASVVPDLATGWSWSEDATQLTFPLRQGVKWHDGKPFTAKDVKCTWDTLLERSADRFRINPRKSW
jgi:peptide/nickel transport system substrate-binding protein